MYMNINKISELVVKFEKQAQAPAQPMSDQTDRLYNITVDEAAFNETLMSQATALQAVNKLNDLADELGLRGTLSVVFNLKPAS